MAKRLAAERPYTPLDASLVSDVLAQAAAATRTTEPTTSRKRRSRETLRPIPIGQNSERGAEAPRVTPRDHSPAAPPPVVQERMATALRVKMSKREKREFEAFVARLAGTLDATVLPSNVLRVLAAVVQNAEQAIAEEARRHLPIRRPSNNDVVAYAEFEHRLVQILDAAIRHATPVR